MATGVRQTQLGFERRQEVLKHLRTHGSASIATICQMVGASPATVHRDLELLADQGLIERVHGGALAVESLDDPPVTGERSKRVAEKRRIALAAMELIDESVKSIFLEASTTVSHLVPLLRGMSDKVLVTNSPEIALEAATGEIEILLIGGDLRRRTLSTVGPLAIQMLGSVSVDLAFIGVSAIDEAGLSSMNAIEVATKSAIIDAAGRVVGLGDASKLGKRALVPVAPLSAMSALITDAAEESPVVQAIREGGLQVRVAS